MAEAPRRIAFQGERGAYGEEATRSLFGTDVEAVAQPTFRAVFEAVAEGRVAGGVIPVESAIAGPVVENVDLILEFAPRLAGELVLRVRHCLLAPPGRTLASISRALSHPQALSQCAGYLARHGIQPIPEQNTAVAARRVAEEAPPRTAAIASRAAADLYGLAVLDVGIEDSPDNFTRFLAVGDAVPPKLSTRRKTAVSFTVADTPGALYRLLGTFASRGLNLSWLASRPSRRPWEYTWFMDVETSQEDPRFGEAIEEARGASTSLRVLGTYALT